MTIDRTATPEKAFAVNDAGNYGELSTLDLASRISQSGDDVARDELLQNRYITKNDKGRSLRLSEHIVQLAEDARRCTASAKGIPDSVIDHASANRYLETVSTAARNLRNPIDCASTNTAKTAPSCLASLGSNPAGGPVVYICESEIRFMARISLQDGIDGNETGGLLFCSFTRGNRPIVFLATSPGPNAVHGSTHFSQDYKWVQQQQVLLWEKFGLQRQGTWHLHHYLNLPHPSPGDTDRVCSISQRNGIAGLLEFIITFEGSPARGVERIDLHPYIYPDIGGRNYLECSLRILPGTSPFRLAVGEEESRVPPAKPKIIAPRRKTIQRRRLARWGKRGKKVV